MIATVIDNATLASFWNLHGYSANRIAMPDGGFRWYVTVDTMRRCHGAAFWEAVEKAYREEHRANATISEEVQQCHN